MLCNHACLPAKEQSGCIMSSRVQGWLDIVRYSRRQAWSLCPSRCALQQALASWHCQQACWYSDTRRCRDWFPWLEIYVSQALVRYSPNVSAYDSQARRGEDPVGNWTIKVNDQEDPKENGRFLGWNLALWGAAIDPSKTTKFVEPQVDNVLPLNEDPDRPVIDR